MDIRKIDIFNREDLIGDQSISTINNLDDYLKSLLSPFNNKLTQMLIELEDIKIDRLNLYPTSLINQLQVEDDNINDSLLTINNSSTITTQSNNYISALNLQKTNLTTILNSKALSTTPLIRPTLLTVTTNNKSAINKAFVINEVLKYSLPLPTPNTRLYVNKESTSLIWA